MPSFLLRTALVLFLGLSLGVSSGVQAAIIGNLEAPDDFASQIGNVQGWVYTTTPGAGLIQPFDVLVNGEKIMEVPCCSARGDVKGDDPDIPLQTGFSAVTNWAREAGDDPITVQVVVRDTAGGEKILTKTNVEVYALASFPFVTDMTWAEVSGPVSLEHLDGPSGVVPGVTSRCTLSNTNSLQFDICDQVRFSWDSGAQGFKQTSDCEQLPRWTDNGDGTATDNTTGLIWELKTDDGSIHDKDDMYTWSTAGSAPDGGAFVLFLATLNGAMSSDGVTTTGCFADKCDWRLPTIEELVGIVDLSAPGCGSGSPCTTIPGENVSPWYWSSSSDPANPLLTWDVKFSDGSAGLGNELFGNRVRAVRGGS